MAEYYFMAQLPSLDGLSENTPLPITEERFSELCSRYLSKKAQEEISRLTLIPEKHGQSSASPLVNKWNEGERTLRLALSKARAEKMKKPFNTETGILSGEMLKLAQTATETESPLEAEVFLNTYRLKFLEALRPMDTFSLDSVFYYGLKLKLLVRMRKFDREKGEAAYKKIYDSIMNGDRLEAAE